MRKKRKSKAVKEHLKKIYNKDKYVLVSKQILLWRKRGGMPNPPVSPFKKPHKIGHKANIQAQYNPEPEKPKTSRDTLLSKFFDGDDNAWRSVPRGTKGVPQD